MAGERGHLPTRPGRATGPTPGPTATTATLIEAIQTIEAFVRSADWPERARDAWKRVKEAAFSHASHGESDASRDIQELKTQVKGLTDLVKGIAIQPTGPASYADALRSKGSPMARGWPEGQRVQPVPARRARELVVAPGAESATQKQRTSLELVRDINTATSGSGDVIAARRLPSGDVLVAFQGVPEKQKWEACPEVLQAFGTGARFRVREYTVLAHGIQVRSVNQADQAGAINSIYAQNPQLKDVVRIVRVGWARRTLKSGKRVAALHIGIAEPKQANHLIDTGLLLDSELHDCELFDGSCYITQCFRCYQYNHTAKHCRNVARCGFCGASGHSSQDCSKKDDRTAFYCIPCHKQGHVSWARECPVRKRQVVSAQQAYACRPSKFQVRATGPQPMHTVPKTATATATATALATACSSQPEASPIGGPTRDPSPKSVIEVEMPDQEPESDSEPEPPVVSKALVRSRKRARPSSTTIDSDSDFLDPQGFTIVRRHQSKARQPGRTPQGTQDIRNALALLPQPPSYE
jgi:hypothetical protein